MSARTKLGSRELTKAEIFTHLAELDRDGFTTVKNWLDPQVTAETLDLVNFHYAQVGQAWEQKIPKERSKDRILYNLQNRDLEFTHLLVEPAIKNILIHKLNDPYYGFIPPSEINYILNYYNARSSGGSLHLHIDSVIPSIDERAWSVQLGIILEDQTEANGCTIVVPGSHRSGAFCDRENATPTPIASKAGDLVIWDSRLWHGTRENKLASSRWTLIATFTMWWVKQSMDICATLPQSIYEKLSDEEKVLLGFASCPPRNEFERVYAKRGYDELPKHVDEVR